VLEGENGITKEADVYSFGMVMIEVWAYDIASIGRVVHQYKVLSGDAPFFDSPPASVMAKILLGERPERPKVPILTDRLWDLIQRCLERNPRRRPGIADVIRNLRGALVDRQRDYADLAKTNDTRLWTAGPQDLVHRASSFVTPSEVVPTGLKGTSTFVYRLLGRRRLNEPLPEGPEFNGVRGIESDKACGIRSEDSHGIHRIELVELGAPVVVQPTFPHLRDLLQRIGCWLLNSSTPSAQDRYNRPDNSRKEQGRISEK